MKITHFRADCFLFFQIQVYIIVCLLFFHFFSARWKENWMRKAPFSNPFGPCLALAADEGRETISHNGYWVWRWWHHCTPPSMGNQRNVLSPPGCLPGYQHAIARDDPRRYVARQVEKKMILMMCLQWNSLLNGWRDGWYFMKSFLHFVITSLLKGIPKGGNFLSLAFIFQVYMRTIAIAANSSRFPGMFLIKTWVDFLISFVIFCFLKNW